MPWCCCLHLTKYLPAEISSPSGLLPLTALQVVEEFMSIADGQLVLTADTSSPQASPTSSEASTSQQEPAAPQSAPGSSQHTGNQGSPWQGLTGSNVDVTASVSRIGCRAYPAAMATLAPSIRFDLAQAVDAQRFGTDRAEAGLQHQQLQRAALLGAALAQPARQPVPLEEQVNLFIVQKTRKSLRP